MNSENAQSFRFTSHIFGLSTKELDTLLKQVNLTWETATPQQVSELIKQHVGVEQYLLCLRWGDTIFRYKERK